MKVTKEKFAANRRAIIEAAIRSFKAEGVDSVGINDIMRSAGLTNGAFYNHFDSKQVLVAQAVAAAFEEAVARVDEASYDELEIGRLIDEHLSSRHRDDLAGGCPTSTLLADAARQGGPARRAFSKGIAAYLSALERCMGAERSPRSVALTTLATMVGSVLLSRAIGDADEALSREFLTAARRKLARERRRQAKLPVDRDAAVSSAGRSLR